MSGHLLNRKVERRTGVYYGDCMGLSFSNRSWRCLYGSRRGRHGPVVRCLGTCCVILRETLYDRLTLEGTGHRPPRRCRSLWDILGGSLADCRPYTTAGNRSALLLTMVTLSTFCLRVSCGVSIRWGSLTFKLALWRRSFMTMLASGCIR